MSATVTKERERTFAREAFAQLADATDRFERYDHPHAVRVARIADEIAKMFHMAPQDRRSLRHAAMLHDLGEAAMDRDYVHAGNALSDEERIDLARHPVIGEQEAARAGADRAAQLLVRWHHEWWNGGGYPDALRREEIPLAARILRLADSYASLTDARPYRAARPEAEARRELVERAGIEFDPRVVAVFLALESFAELHSFAKPEQLDPSESATAQIGEDRISEHSPSPFEEMLTSLGFTETAAGEERGFEFVEADAPKETEGSHGDHEPSEEAGDNQTSEAKEAKEAKETRETSETAETKETKKRDDDFTLFSSFMR
jgi:hypothetical protein